MKHAELPRERMQLTIGDMEIGEVGFTAPSALFVDDERHLWLTPSVDVTRDPKKFRIVEDYTMPIGRAAAGYVVTLDPDQVVRRGTPRVESIPVVEWLTS